MSSLGIGPQALTAQDGPFPTPHKYVLAAKESFEPQIVSVTFDGSGAAGAFLPCCSIYSQDGHLLSRTFPASVAAGDKAEVSFGPFLEAPSSPTGVIPPPTPASGWKAYAIFTAGEAGTWQVPSVARLVLAIALGAGGGGGGAQRSGNNAQYAGPGRGGGGGGLTIAWHDAEQLASEYPLGVPYSVGLGGGGGQPSPLLTAGANGQPTSFGKQAAGGGGGGRAGDLNNDTSAGSGGGITSANLNAGGQPLGQSTGPSSVGSQSGVQVGPGAFPAATEYGGAAGACAANNKVIGTPCPGIEGGHSLWGGGGGGGGAGYAATAADFGGKGGISGDYTTNANEGNGGGNPGGQSGMWAGGGGDGGHAQGPGGANGLPGQNGGLGGGGGGGGAAGVGVAMQGGAGGGGQLWLYVFG